MIESVAAVHSIAPVIARSSARAPKIPQTPTPQTIAVGFYQNSLADGATLVAAQEAGQHGASGAGANAGRDTNAEGLTQEQQAQVTQLRKRDAEVRRHESAHASAGGPFAGAASFEYQRGPDGRLYAVGGEVKIDVSPVGSPEATVQKMEVIKRAALAPADPSSQDRAVAAAAEQIKQQALAEQRDQETEEAAQIKERNEARQNGEAPDTSTDISEIFQAAAAYSQVGGLLSSPSEPPKVTPGHFADLLA